MKSTKHIKHILFLFLLIIISTQNSCKNSNSDVKLFAAAGTTLPVNEICNTSDLLGNINIEKNFAASGALARQIKSGADADMYISANKQWIDYLKENDLLIPEKIQVLTQNDLVIICLKEKSLHIEFENDFNIKSTIIDKIAIGDPKYVPAGAYAKQVLDSLNWFNKIENQVILAKDVTSVLHYIELGECDWGIVYYSEALKSEKIRIAYEIPKGLYDPIFFYIALLNENPNTKILYNSLLNNNAKKIFSKYGFNSNVDD